MKPRVCSNGRCDTFLVDEVGPLCSVCKDEQALAHKRRELKRMEALGLWRLECERLPLLKLVDEAFDLAEFPSPSNYSEDKLEIAKLILARRIEELS